MEAKRLRQLRLRKNENQTSVAENLNLSREAYSSYETGRRQPSYDTLAAIARHYHVSVDYLLGATDIPFSYTELDDRERYIMKCLPYMDDRTKDYILSIIRHNPNWEDSQWKKAEEFRNPEKHPR